MTGIRRIVIEQIPPIYTWECKNTSEESFWSRTKFQEKRRRRTGGWGSLQNEEIKYSFSFLNRFLGDRKSFREHCCKV